MLNLQMNRICSVTLITKKKDLFENIELKQNEHFTYRFDGHVEAFRIEASAGEDKAWTNFYKLK